MSPHLLIAVYSIAVVASSLFGGWLPSLFNLTHVRMQVALSFVGGTMLGVGMLHMLPHSYVETGSLDTSIVWLMVGLLGMFLLIRTFHFHEHGPALDGLSDGESPAHSHDDPSTESKPANHDHGHAHGHGHSHSHAGCQHGHGVGDRPEISSVSWLGVACGLSLHTFLDGVALAAGVISDLAHRGTVGLAGFGVFLAIVLHKPLDALSITTLMQARGSSRNTQQAVNAGFAAMCPAGALVFAAWVQAMGDAQHYWVGVALAISAGVFLCISLSDLLPEVQFHHHDRLKLSAALVLGVLCAYGIHLVEPPHAHHGPAAVDAEYDEPQQLPLSE
ncbi:MAG: ZIP family metal transporter [Planctomycetales bacterium]|nr:ZIP family metal transporter [Planctomycetales bacterium]MCA9169571.1 ZIP family metal transporter [Planctomycetales bacterium]